MNFLQQIPALVLIMAAVAGLASSCASRSAGERRSEKHPELYSGLSESERKLVSRGEISESMSPDAVFLAWGRPDRIRTGSRNGKKTETWAYFAMTPVARPGFSYGNRGHRPFYSRFGVHPTFGYGTGAGWNYGTDIDFARHVEKEVRFVNDLVVSWDRIR